MPIESDPIDVRRQAGWLPPGQDQLEDWIDGQTGQLESDDEARNRPLHPAVAAYGQLIDSDPVLRMLARQMIDQVPDAKRYRKRHLHSVEQMLRLIDALIRTAPGYSSDSMVMTPFAGIIDWTMGTRAGYEFYRDPRVNAALKDVLSAWCDYLDSEASASVINDSDNGWAGEAAQRAVGMDQYQHDPSDPHWGFHSWNDFFTRHFKDGERPVAGLDDDRVIVSACESTPYNLRTDVQRHDRFWIKSQPYSLEDLLDHDDAVDQFVGGTVYQAFLSALNYHRWHSPVAGTVVRAYTVDGTYFAEAQSEGTNSVQPTNSQGYQAHVAARAIVLIQADNPAIGLVALVPVGMVEVSSCRIRPELVPGYHLDKGEEVGHFRYGGSTHCLVFRPGVIADFALQALPRPGDPDAPLVQVRSHIATAADR